MDFGVATNKGVNLVISTHSNGKKDDTPLQLISADMLAHYRRIEAEHAKLMVAGCAQRRRGSDSTRMIIRNPSP